MAERKKMVTGMACAAVVAATASMVSAAVAPYTNDFSSASGATTGAQGGQTTSSWNVVSGTYQNTLSATVSAQTYTYAGWQMTNLGGASATASDFVISTDVIRSSTGFVDGNSASNVTAGLAALGDTEKFARYGGSKYYLANIQMFSHNATIPTGRMSISEYISNSSGVTLTTMDFNGTIVADHVYKMSLTGDYTGGQLTLKLSFDDPTDANAATVLTVGPSHGSTTLTTAVSQGKYFGYRDQISNGMTQTLVYDNFVVNNSIPEPATLSLAGLAGLSLMARRRKVL